jgi:hypothetical protein
VDALQPYIKNFDTLTEEERSKLIIHYFRGTELLDKMDLTLKELQYIEDEDYYVDIEEELKKDLYEKQRVVDNFLIEYDQERLDLLGYHENLYHKATPAKYLHRVFVNTFNLPRIRSSLALCMFNTSLLTVGLALVNPLLPLVLVYDYYHILKYMNLLNRTILNMTLHNMKRKVFKTTLNFLGYWKKPRKDFEFIRDIKYMGKFERAGIDPNRLGMLPSMLAIARLFRRITGRVGVLTNFRERVIGTL